MNPSKTLQIAGVETFQVAIISHKARPSLARGHVLSEIFASQMLQQSYQEIVMH